MTADAFTTVDTVTVDDFRRDHYDRPLILQPDGTRIGYTRSSTAAKVIEDTYNLERWARRNVAYGIAYDASLVARLIALGGNPATWGKAEKDAVNEICEKAEGVAQAHKGADIGSALHHLTHRLDRGEDVDAGPYQDDLTAYVNTCLAHQFEIDRRYIECRIVNDLLRMAGSADRIVNVDGIYRIADIKTGQTINYGTLGWAAQLAAYAGGVLYDVATEQRLPTPPIDQTTGYIIHLPAGQGVCTIHEINLFNGHRAAELANEIRAVRKASKHWMTPLSTWVTAPEVSTPPVERTAGEVVVASPATVAAPTVSPSVRQQPAPTPPPGVGAPTIAAPVSQDPATSRRRGLLDRWRNLSELDKQRFEARNRYIAFDDYDAIDKLLTEIEATATRDRTRPAPVTVPPSPHHPDEGDGVHPLAIADLQDDYHALDSDAKAWVDSLVSEGYAADVPWHTGGLHSQRRYQLGRAIVALAGWGWGSPTLCPADIFDIIRGLLGEATGREEVEQDNLPLGAAIGTLDATEATRFAQLVDDYLDPGDAA